MPLNSGQIFNSNKIWVKLPNLSINNKCLAFDKIIVLLKGKIIAMIAIFIWESSDILTPVAQDLRCYSALLIFVADDSCFETDLATF